MVTAIGLERLETGLDGAPDTATEVAELLAPAAAVTRARHTLGPPQLAYAFTGESVVSRN